MLDGIKAEARHARESVNNHAFIDSSNARTRVFVQALPVASMFYVVTEIMSDFGQAAVVEEMQPILDRMIYDPGKMLEHNNAMVVIFKKFTETLISNPDTIATTPKNAELLVELNKWTRLIPMKIRNQDIFYKLSQEIQLSGSYPLERIIFEIGSIDSTIQDCVRKNNLLQKEIPAIQNSIASCDKSISQKLEIITQEKQYFDILAIERNIADIKKNLAVIPGQKNKLKKSEVLSLNKKLFMLTKQLDTRTAIMNASGGAVSNAENEIQRLTAVKERAMIRLKSKQDDLEENSKRLNELTGKRDSLVLKEKSIERVRVQIESPEQMTGTRDRASATQATEMQHTVADDFDPPTTGRNRSSAETSSPEQIPSKPIKPLLPKSTRPPLTSSSLFKQTRARAAGENNENQNDENTLSNSAPSTRRRAS
ncbi:MAG: hypothetical protein ABI597_00885 [Gammaproteobacteria bacterium]